MTFGIASTEVQTMGVDLAGLLRVDDEIRYDNPPYPPGHAPPEPPDPPDAWHKIASINVLGSTITLENPYGFDRGPGTALVKKAWPVVVGIGMSVGRELPDAARPALQNAIPDWVRDHGYRPTENIISTTAGDFRMYAKAFGTEPAYFGPNEGGSDDNMYIVVVEPMRWFVGEEIADIVFRPPIDYVPLPWGDGENVWSGPVPEYVDVIVHIPDESLDIVDEGTGIVLKYGTRRFVQRMRLPGGE
jgi:hypothetical protein